MKKTLSILLSFVMMITTLSVFSVNAFANDDFVCDSENHILETKIVPATLEEDGLMWTACTVCYITTYEKEIPYAKSFSLSTTSYTYDGNYKKPTVTVKASDGTTVSKSNYTVTYSNNKLVGKAKAVVKFNGKNYQGTKVLYYTIKPKGTSISSLSALRGGFKATWKKQSQQTDGYQIKYSTSSKFTKSKYATVTSNKTLSKKVTKLTKGKKYYVRVRTYKIVDGKKYYSSWSKYKTVTTKR